jgi:hypothetical protein
VSSRDTVIYVCDSCKKEADPILTFNELPVGWFVVHVFYRSPCNRLGGGLKNACSQDCFLSIMDNTIKSMLEASEKTT